MFHVMRRGAFRDATAILVAACAAHFVSPVFAIDLPSSIALVRHDGGVNKPVTATTAGAALLRTEGTQAGYPQSKRLQQPADRPGQSRPVMHQATANDELEPSVPESTESEAAIPSDDPQEPNELPDPTTSELDPSQPDERFNETAAKVRLPKNEQDKKDAIEESETFLREMEHLESVAGVEHTTTKSPEPLDEPDAETKEEIMAIISLGAMVVIVFFGGYGYMTYQAQQKELEKEAAAMAKLQPAAGPATSEAPADAEPPPPAMPRDSVAGGAVTFAPEEEQVGGQRLSQQALLAQ